MRARETAIHEAAHAVVARALGLTCGGVSIEAESAEGIGHAVFADPRFSWARGDGPKRAAADAFCVALYAGAEAERIILGISGETGDDSDCERATACMAWAGVRGAVFVGDDAFDRNEARLRTKARAEVVRHRARIERLAGEVLECGKMSAAEVERALR